MRHAPDPYGVEKVGVELPQQLDFLVPPPPRLLLRARDDHHAEVELGRTVAPIANPPLQVRPLQFRHRRVVKVEEDLDERGIGFETALEEAQAKGYAEPDPTLDVEGIDTAHKIAILASLAFSMDIRSSDVWVEGIKAIQPIDFRFARELGYAIKLLGIAKLDEETGRAEVRVHPTLVPLKSQLAPIRGVYNAILVEAEPLGPTMYYGQGAGPRATSSAVVSDLMAIAADEAGFNRHRDARLSVPVGRKNLRPRDELRTHYYLRFTVVDRPGTMARLSQALGDKGISIESMIQHNPESDAEAHPAGGATVTIVTRQAVEKDVRACLEHIAGTQINVAAPFVLRVEE